MNEILGATGRSLTERRQGRRLKSLLVAAEFALAMVLLTGAGLLIHSFIAVLRLHPGFRPESALTVQIGLPETIPAAQTPAFYREVMQRISVLPGVQAVGGAGVVGDTRIGGLEKTPFSQIYEVQAQRTSEQIGNLVIRTAGNPADVASTLRTVIHQVNHNVVVSSITTIEALLDQQKLQRRFQTCLVSVFSALALALAAVGVFGVMHYSVAARTHEIGIRVAVGAKSSDIARLVLGNGTTLAAAGIALGALTAAWATKVISGMLYEVKPRDPLSFAGAAILLLTVALLATYLPAHRASHIDPMTALRQE